MSAPHDQQKADAATGTEDRDLLLERLRDPVGIVRHRWCASGPSEAGVIDLNRLLPLVRLWMERDPEIAAELVHAAFAAQAPGGAVPRRFDTQGRSPAFEAPWPLLARAALLVWRQEGSRAFLEAVLPPLDAYLTWAMRYFDPQGEGHLCWPSDVEAFVPDTWDRGLATVDLTALLLSETESMIEMAGGLQDVPMHVPRLEARRRMLADRLVRFFWDEDARLFRDRYADGTWVSRRTLSARLPLLWEGLPPTLRAAWIGSLEEQDPLRGPHGMRLWEPWPDDPELPPSPPWQQAVALEAYRAAGWQEGCDLLCSALSERTVSTPDGGVREGEMAHAVLGLLSRQPGPGRTGRALPAWVGWVDRRPRLAAAAGVLLLASFFGTVVAFHTTRSRLPGSAIEALNGLALAHYRRGDYPQALALYEQLLDNEQAPILHLYYANTLYRVGRYAEAERHYRAVLSREADVPLAMYNLAQTLYREGRGEEAADLLEEVIRQYSVDYPEVTHLSRVAVALMRNESGRADAASTP